MFHAIYFLLGFLVFVYGVNSKSIQNETVDESKFVTFDRLNNWKRNMTDYITNMMEQIFVYGVNSKSIQNETVDESKFVTFDRLNNWKRNMTDYITNMMEQNNIKERKRVFFHAKMSASDITYNANSIVRFGTVLYNEGNHFNPGDSVFVSPVSGVYLFSWTTQSSQGKAVNTELRVDNNVKETLNANLGSAVGRLSVTRVVITKVNENDHIWIQTSGEYSEHFFDYVYSSQSSFTGVLLFTI